MRGAGGEEWLKEGVKKAEGVDYVEWEGFVSQRT